MSEPPRDAVFRADGLPVPPEQVARIWRELALGYWRVLAAVDADGTRYVAIAPLTRSPTRWKALRDRERQVLALATKGKPQKIIAAELGVTAATVSEALGAARARLGFRTVAELLRAYEACESPLERD